jgi:hypothetical protein
MLNGLGRSTEQGWQNKNLVVIPFFGFPSSFLERNSLFFWSGRRRREEREREEGKVHCRNAWILGCCVYFFLFSFCAKYDGILAQEEGTEQVKNHRAKWSRRWRTKKEGYSAVGCSICCCCCFFLRFLFFHTHFFSVMFFCEMKRKIEKEQNGSCTFRALGEGKRKWR